MSKRDAILAAAGTAFARHGFHAVAVDQIVAAAGTTPRTFYKHFPSKLELVLAVLDDRQADLDGALRAAAAQRPDSTRGAAMAALFAALDRWHADHAGNGCLFLRARGEYHEASVRQRVDAHAAALRRVVVDVLDAGPDDEALVDGLLLLLEGMTAALPALGHDRALAAARRAAAALLLRAAADASLD